MARGLVGRMIARLGRWCLGLVLVTAWVPREASAQGGPPQVHSTASCRPGWCFDDGTVVVAAWDDAAAPGRAFFATHRSYVFAHGRRTDAVGHFQLLLRRGAERWIVNETVDGASIRALAR